jgi:hypothetical protein
MEIKDIIAILDKKIFEFKDDLPVGLANGKVGYCIYCYQMNMIYKYNTYKIYAEQLIDDIYANISSCVKQYDIQNGIADIGLGIDFIINKQFVKGDSNQILSDIDTELYKQLSYPVNCDKLGFAIHLQILYYFIIRLIKQKQGSEQEWLFKELII